MLFLTFSAGTGRMAGIGFAAGGKTAATGWKTPETASHYSENHPRNLQETRKAAYSG